MKKIFALCIVICLAVLGYKISGGKISEYIPTFVFKTETTTNEYEEPVRPEDVLTFSKPISTGKEKETVKQPELIETKPIKPVKPEEPKEPILDTNIDPQLLNECFSYYTVIKTYQKLASTDTKYNFIKPLLDTYNETLGAIDIYKPIEVTEKWIYNKTFIGQLSNLLDNGPIPMTRIQRDFNRAK